MQSNRETLEKKLDLECRVFSPTTSVLARKFFEIRESVLVPSAEGFHDERLEMNPLGAAVVKVCPVFGNLPGFNGGGRVVGGLEDDGFLRGRGHADVKSDLSPVDPVFNVDVGRARKSPWDEAWHLLSWVQRVVLGNSEDFVPYAIMSAPLHAVIVAAVESVIAKGVLRLEAGRGATIAGRKKRKAEAVSHRCSKGP